MRMQMRKGKLCCATTFTTFSRDCISIVLMPAICFMIFYFVTDETYSWRFMITCRLPQHVQLEALVVAYSFVPLLQKLLIHYYTMLVYVYFFQHTLWFPAFYSAYLVYSFKRHSPVCQGVTMFYLLVAK